MRAWRARCLAIGLVLVIPASARAFEVPTHRLIADEAVQSSVLGLGYLESEVGVRAGSILRNARGSAFTAAEWVREGSDHEDDTLNGVFARYRNHFYDPVYDQPLTSSRGVQIGRRAFEWALEENGPIPGQDRSWVDARRTWLGALTSSEALTREHQLAETLLTLGHVIHLVQDMASPEHTRNDWHAGVRFLGSFPLGAPSPFEEMLKALPFSVRRDGYPAPSLSRVRDYWATGDGRGLGEFTNRGFVTKATNFIAADEGAVGRDPGSGRLYPEPRLQLALRTDAPVGALLPGTSLQGLVTFFGNDITDHVTGEVHTNERMTTFSLFDAELLRRQRQPLFTLNRFNVLAAADFLVPRAVGYSAGLLNHFFRGRLEVELVPDSADPLLVRIEGKNASPAALDGGILALYADVPVTDFAGGTRLVRQPATAVDADLTATAEPDATVRSARFQLPDGAERFMAVYRGKLGEERPVPNDDPSVDNPGAVIGKLLGGQRVEHVFPDFASGFWMLRTPAGVFTLPIGTDDIVVLRWGDADNTLVGRTAFGRLFGEPNQIASFEILRPEGSTGVPLQNGMVRLVERVRRPVPVGLAVGTRIELSHTIQFEQKLVTYEHDEVFRDSQRTENSVSHRDVETFTDSKVLVASWNVTLDLDKFTANATRPYVWRIPEVALRRDGTILALVEVTLTAPTEPNTFASFPTRKYASPAPGCRFPCEAPVQVAGSNVGIAHSFPPAFNAIGYIVDVNRGVVLHSTAPPVVSFTHSTRATRWNDTSQGFAATEFHKVTRVDTSTEPPTTVTGYEYDTDNNQRGGLCSPASGFQQLDAINANEGTTFVSLVRFRPELAAVDAPIALDPVVRRERFCVSADEGTTFGYGVTTSAPRQQVPGFHFETSARAPGTPERLVFEIQEPTLTPPTISARIVFWDPEAGVATMHQVTTQEEPNIVSVGREAAWLRASTTATYVPREQAKTPTTFLIDFSPALAFRILDDKRLYSADTLRFHALDPALRPTALPAVLPGGANRSGHYHVIQIK